MSESQFRVRVTKDHLVFSAAHFITFNGNVCERLHGHNWRVAVEVAGPLDENQYVFDFIALRDSLQAIVNELDHRMLLPTQHPTIHVTASETEVEARFADRRWVFPREDCILLPISNTTAERIAEWIAGRLRAAFHPLPQAQHLTELQVEVEENFGQWAVVRMPLP
ncbi:MAG TPA: 6-pyruvoyl tetrahydropterin synthase family protein [Planctomycetaceae bacterium]|nr:6-pyruvoyl tetrahydropterin synthase family protein [Planctomycetaceae bacterium]